MTSEREGVVLAHWPCNRSCVDTDDCMVSICIGVDAVASASMYSGAALIGRGSDYGCCRPYALLYN